MCTICRLIYELYISYHVVAALSDDNWRKCPICYESIQKTDLRSVVIVQQANYVTGAEIEMRLMQRERNSLLAVPVGQLEDEKDNGQLYVKLVKASRAQVPVVPLQIISDTDTYCMYAQRNFVSREKS
jgi:hypothetical protein